MSVCKFCKQRDDTPSGASVIASLGDYCGRCGMTYKQMRAARAEEENQSLSEFGGSDD